MRKATSTELSEKLAKLAAQPWKGTTQPDPPARFRTRRQLGWYTAQAEEMEKRADDAKKGIYRVKE